MTKENLNGWDVWENPDKVSNASELWIKEVSEWANLSSLRVSEIVDWKSNGGMWAPSAQEI